MNTSLIISIISLCLTGLLGIFNACLAFQNYKYKKQEIIREQKAKEEGQRRKEFEMRPRFEFVSAEKHYEIKEIPSEQSECDVDVLFASIIDYKNIGRHTFYYAENLDDSKNWVNATYKLKNIGSEIQYFRVSTNLPKNTALFDTKECKLLIKNNMLNYSVLYDKKPIKQNSEITIRINYMKDKIIASNIGSAPITIWMIDTNNNIWAQPLFTHEDKIYDSKRESHEIYRTETQIDTALKCFENPYLW